MGGGGSAGKRALVLAVPLAALCLALAWRGLGGGAPALGGAAGEIPAAIERESAETRAPERAPRRADAEEPSREDAAAEPEAAPAAAELLPFPDAREARELTWLDLRRPDADHVDFEDVRLELVAQDGRRFEHREAGPTRSLRLRIPAGRYRVVASARGHAGIARPLEVSRELAERLVGLDGPPMLIETVTLLPEGWAALVVETRDGRPFSALAADAELPLARLFAGAFEARGVEGEPTLRYHAGLELAPGVAGAIEPLAPPPFEVELWLHGAPHERRTLEPGARELRFTLDGARLDARLAGLSLRVVDAGSGAPAPDARATLRTVGAERLEPDLRDRGPDADGRLAFARLIPGDYALTVEREGALAQRRLALRAGEARELGALALATGPGIALQVIAPEAARSRRFDVELTPLDDALDGGASTPLRLRTDAEGALALPRPDRPTVLRAQDPTSRPAKVATPYALLDPAILPSTLELEARELVRTSFEPATPWVEGHRLVLRDELGVPLARLTDLRYGFPLVPGRYRVERWAGDALLGAIEVLVDPDRRCVAAP